MIDYLEHNIYTYVNLNLKIIGSMTSCSLIYRGEREREGELCISGEKIMRRNLILLFFFVRVTIIVHMGQWYTLICIIDR